MVEPGRLAQSGPRCPLHTHCHRLLRCHNSRGLYVTQPDSEALRSFITPLIDSCNERLWRIVQGDLDWMISGEPQFRPNTHPDQPTSSSTVPCRSFHVRQRLS